MMRTGLHFFARITIAALALIGSVPRLAWAELPPPTPAQQQAAADKKAKADAQAAEEKKKLAASMEQLAEHWRSRAKAQGWKTYPPVAATPAAESKAESKGTPGSGQGNAPPLKSEKAGTAPPSADVKPDKPVSIR